MAKRRTQAPPPRLILDAGAVIALSRADVLARGALAAAAEVGAEVSIPAVVVTETVCGARTHAPVNRVFKAVGEIDSIDEAIGRAAGRLLGETGSSSTVEAIVIATAVAAGGAVVLTGDPEDLIALAAAHREVVIQPL